MKWHQVLVVVAVVAVTLAFFALTVSAGGLYGRWLNAGAVVYTDPDAMSDVSVTVTQTTAVSVTLSTGWAEITAPPELVGYVQSGQLLREEPQVLKNERARAAQVAAQAALDVTKVGNLTWLQLKELLAGLGFAPTASSAVVAATPAVPATTSSTYVVKAGDYLSKIAGDNGVTLQALLDANGLTVASVIHPGDKLVIPSSGTTAAPVVSTSGWPATAEEFLRLATQGQPAAPADKSWIPIQLSEIHRPVGEPNAWAVTREKNDQNVIIPFWISNFSGRAQNGYCQTSSGKMATGCPVGFKGLSEGVTFRP